MATHLKKREGTEEWTVEIFDLELDESSQAEMDEDPSGFLRRAIESEGLPINGLMIDEKMLKSQIGGDAPVLNGTVVAHVVLPASKKSKYISISSETEEEGGTGEEKILPPR